MAGKNPLSTIKDVADLAVAGLVSAVTETVKDPVGTGKKVVGQAVGQVAAVAGAVSTRLPGRTSPTTPKTAPIQTPEVEKD